MVRGFQVCGGEHNQHNRKWRVRLYFFKRPDSTKMRQLGTVGPDLIKFNSP